MTELIRHWSVDVLFQQYTCFMNELATKCSQILFQVCRYAILSRRCTFYLGC